MKFFTYIAGFMVLIVFLFSATAFIAAQTTETVNVGKSVTSGSKTIGSSDLQTTTVSGTTESNTDTISGTTKSTSENISGDISSDLEEISDSIQTIKTLVPSSDYYVDYGDKEQIPAEKIEAEVESSLGPDVDLTSDDPRISEAVKEVTDKVREQEERLSSRGGLELYRDSDSDGVSDYDEKFIYGTDPENPKTAGTELTDSERILRGLDPAATTTEPNVFDDPRISGKVVKKVYSVDEVKVVEKKEDEQGKLVASKLQFKGRALPNSFVTIYVFSTPIIVTVKADETGSWSYTLDRELEDGQHEMYVATVNNTGRILAKSDAVPFVKQAAAAEIGSLSQPDDTEKSFFDFNLLTIAIIILVIAVIIAIVIVGISSARKQKEFDIPTEEKPEDQKDV